MDGVGLFNYSRTDKPYALTDVSADTNHPPVQSKGDHTIEYTSFNRPGNITQGDNITIFTYNTNGERVKTLDLAGAATPQNRYYIGGQYELASGLVNKELLYLGGDPYSAPAVYVKQGNT